MSNFPCPHCGELIAPRKAKGKTVRTEEIVGLLRFGATPTELAPMYGVSRQRIHQIGKEAGLLDRGIQRRLKA